MEINPIYKFYKELEFKDYVEIALRRKKVIITLFISGVRTFTTTPVYSASTQIMIEEEEGTKIPTMRDIYQMRAPTEVYYRTQYKILESRTLAERVVNKLNLQASPAFQYGDPSKILLRMVDIVPQRKTRLVNVKVESENPQLAATIANTFAEEYIAKSLDDKLGYTEHALGWLNNEIDEMKAKVEESERTLQDYKEKNELVSLEDSQNITVQKLGQLSQAATDAKSKRLAAESKFRQIEELKLQGRSLETLPAIRDNPFINKLKSTYAEKEGDLSELLKRYKEKHPKIIELKSELATLEERIETEIDKVLESITSEHEEAKANENAVLVALAEQEKQALSLNRMAIEYDVLKREAETNRELYKSLLKKMKETDISGGLKQSHASIVDRAEVPKVPVRPKKFRNMVLACIMGLLLGSGAAFIIEYTDDTVRSQKDIEKHIQLPFLGHIPIIKARGLEVALYSDAHPRSEPSEALRSCKTNINFTLNSPPPHVLLLTSAIPAEGKTSATVNLGIVMAQGGSKTLLVDADMRHPSVHKPFKLDNSKGLKDYLANTEDFDSVVKKTTVENLWVISSGPIPHNPIELLSTPRLVQFVEEVKSRFNKVIIDSPPLIAVSDALLLAKVVDGVILMVKGAEAAKDTILTAVKKLENIDARILGVVLNNIDLVREKYYYSYYHHGEKVKKRKKERVPAVIPIPGEKPKETPPVAKPEAGVEVHRIEEEKREEKAEEIKPAKGPTSLDYILSRRPRREPKPEPEEGKPPEEEPREEPPPPKPEPKAEAPKFEKELGKKAEEIKPARKISRPRKILKPREKSGRRSFLAGFMAPKGRIIKAEKAESPKEVSVPKEKEKPPKLMRVGGVEAFKIKREPTERIKDTRPPEEVSKPKEKPKKRSLFGGLVARRPKREPKIKAEKIKPSKGAPKTKQRPQKLVTIGDIDAYQVAKAPKEEIREPKEEIKEPEEEIRVPEEEAREPEEEIREPEPTEDISVAKEEPVEEVSPVEEEAKKGAEEEVKEEEKEEPEEEVKEERPPVTTRGGVVEIPKYKEEGPPVTTRGGVVEIPKYKEEEPGEQVKEAKPHRKAKKKSRGSRRKRKT